jgi:HK97 gp10 family phage protein
MIGLKISIVNGPQVAELIGRDIEKLEQELAYRIVDEARTLMDSSTPGGRLYRKGRFTRRNKVGGQRASGAGMRIHRASAPGQPPAEDSGKLYRDIKVTRLKSGHYRVRFGASYAGYLEFGTRNMSARPFVLPSIQAAVEKTFNR